MKASAWVRAVGWCKVTVHVSEGVTVDLPVHIASEKVKLQRDSSDVEEVDVWRDEATHHHAVCQPRAGWNILVACCGAVVSRWRRRECPTVPPPPSAPTPIVTWTQVTKVFAACFEALMTATTSCKGRMPTSEDMPSEDELLATIVRQAAKRKHAVTASDRGTVAAAMSKWAQLMVAWLPAARCIGFVWAPACFMTVFACHASVSGCHSFA